VIPISFTHVIVGCGLSGSLALIELLRKHSAPISIAVLEENPHRLFKGKAYSADVPVQVLNVPADHMSAYWDQPMHLVKWMEARGLVYGASDFIPRQIFGSYLAEVVHEALGAHPQHRVQFFMERLEVIQPDGNNGYALRSAKHDFTAQHVWMATGNFSPADIVSNPEVVQHPNYLGDPWRGAGLRFIPNGASILLVGTGLTMVDQVLSLQAQGHRGAIYALSRRGFYPQPHQLSPAYSWFAAYAEVPTSPLSLLQLVRSEVRRAAELGIPWTSVVNDLRAYTPMLWQNWDLSQRQQFLRHVRPYWEVHRHRLPAASIAALNALEGRGQLMRFGARLADVSATEQGFCVRFVPRGAKEAQTLDVNWILNCTGPQSLGKKLNESWIQSGMAHELLKADALNLGIELSTKANDRLHLIGPPRKGSSWESTALREIRQQVKEEVAKL
jgi:uncharacterized NAD(P)/FAD-binding protein YdhS